MTTILTSNQLIFKTNSKVYNRKKAHSGVENIQNFNIIFGTEFREPTPTLSPSDIKNESLSGLDLVEIKKINNESKRKLLPMEVGFKLRTKLQDKITEKLKEHNSLKSALKELEITDDDINEGLKNVLKKLLKQNYIDRYNSYLKYYKELSSRINERKNRSNSSSSRPRSRLSKNNDDYLITSIIVESYDFSNETNETIDNETIDEIFTKMNDYQEKIDNIYFILKTILSNAKELSYEIRSLKNYIDILNKEIDFMQKILFEISSD